MIKFSFDEIIDIIRSYQFEQECIMDSCDNVNSYEFIKAEKKYDAANELMNKFWIKYTEVDYEK